MSQELIPSETPIETTDDGNRQQPQIYAKDSMDRYGDDLFKILVSYLSFKDRFRLEYVSKQFRRTVFGSVVDITLTDRFIQRLLNKETIDTQLLATIAIKCTNIEIIDCQRISAEYEKHIPEVLNIFRDNCQHLREIYCNLCDGQWMPSLWPLVTRINYRSEDSQALTHCHRLSHLLINSFKIIFDSIDDQLLAKNLTKFGLCYLTDDDNHRWPEFLADNQCLQSLIVSSCRLTVAENLRQMCEQLSQLTQLRELGIGLVDGQNSAVITDSLRTIGEKCKQLKRLSLLFGTYSVAEPVLTISLDSLRFYPRLKRLNLTIFQAIDDRLLERLRHCKRLTHLRLCLHKMRANMMKDCHLFCPRLEYLLIYANDYVIDSECLSHISRLRALRTLVIDGRDYGHDSEDTEGFGKESNDPSDNDFKDLLFRSPKLETIDVRIKNEKKFYSK